MTFTNTTSAEYYICWQVKVQANDQVDDQCGQVWNQVDDEVSWKAYDQIKPIRTKIKQEINK
jgi:hypothetical protein